MTTMTTMTNSQVARVVAAAALAAVAACGGRDDGPPVATPAVTFNRASVSLGGPIQATYRFTVAPGASIPGNFVVFVHFIDQDGDLMWTDDHEPPTPTSAWKPGDEIEYTRTFFVPVYPYLGPATVRVGLYDPASQQRLTLTGKDNGLKAYDVASLELQPQSRSPFVVYGAGWYPPESSPDNALDEWRWTTGSSAWSFRNPGRDAILYLEVDGRPDLFNPPQQISIKVGDQVADTFAVDEEAPALHKSRISADAFGSGEIVNMSLDVDKTFVPAQQAGGGSDARVLGIRVFHLFVEPQ